MSLKKTLRVSVFTLLGLVALLAVCFFTILKMDNALAGQPIQFPKATYTQPILLSSLFLNGERFYFRLRTAQGDTILAYGDSGGGTCMVAPAAISKLKLSAVTRTAMIKGIMPISYIPFRQLIPDERVPLPVVLNTPALRRPFARVTEPFLLVPPEDGELKMITAVMPFDLFLGQNFFMGKAWTIDYPRRQIWVNTPVSPKDSAAKGVLKLEFRRNDMEQVLYGHPRMQIVVDGVAIDVLFDTGASIILSDDGKRLLGTSDKTIAASFIAKSVFDQWRDRHPAWKLYPKADNGRDVIEVPQVRIGGYEVGPVLFAVRNDAAWSEGMAGTMDQVVKGAIGGSALKYFKVTIDYNSALIRFER